MAAVLVIDDEPIVRDMITRTLSRAGHAVTPVASAGTALHHLKRGTCDVVITDMMLRGDDGARIISRIRHEYPRVGIIAVSGHGTQSDCLQGALDVGADAILSKPFARAEMLAAIDAVIRKHKLVSARAKL